MDRGLNREILRLSGPSILANLTVPLVGFVDTGVAGHLSGGAAAFIGAISLGAMIFNLLYWNFGFLRTGTGGLTAQAYGRGDMHECAVILFRGLILSMIIAVLILALQWPVATLVLRLTDGSSEVETLAAEYFFIRIWAAPATLSLMTFSGWFVGMQDSMSSMWKDLVVNGTNVTASVILSLGIGGWSGLGFPGVALGTVVAQYCGLLFCLIVCAFKYRSKVFGGFCLDELKEMLGRSELRGFFKLNADLFCRSIFFTSIYIGYTAIAATLGDMMLACSSIMMQMLLIFSFFTDGFAYAAEALTGRFIGARNPLMMRRSIKYTLIWSLSIGFLFIGIYAAGGLPMLNLLTSDSAVVEACSRFLPWLMLMPPIGCVAFFWDGVYMGATASKDIRDAMIGSSLCFFAVWLAGKWIAPDITDETAMDLLLGAYFAHLIFRSAILSIRYFPLRRRVI